MESHVFKVGDLVRLRTPGVSTPGTVYQVRQCLPAGPDGDVLYRVKAYQDCTSGLQGKLNSLRWLPLSHVGEGLACLASPEG